MIGQDILGLNYTYIRVDLHLVQPYSIGHCEEERNVLMSETED
jgi:hypothetical protein